MSPTAACSHLLECIAARRGHGNRSVGQFPTYPTIRDKKTEGSMV